MIMKKLLPLFCLLFAAMQVQAQVPVGSVSLIPRLGYTCSRLAGLPAIEDFDKGCLWGATAGLDVELQASRVVAVSLGAAYSRQGASFVPCSDISYYTSSSVKYEERVGYVNFPVMASAYLFKGFALKAGLQAGVRLGESEMAKKVEYLLSGYESDEEQYYSALYAIHNLQLPVFILDMEESGDITKEESDALFCLIKRIANHWVTIGKGVYTKSSTYTDQKSGETREVSLYIKEGDNDIMFGIPNADSIAIYMVNNEYYNDATNDLTWDNANNAVRGNITRVDEGRIKAEKMEDMDIIQQMR